MRALLVDDDETFLDAVVPEFEKITGAENLRVAKSRDSAIANIDNSYYDILVLDLKIPTVDRALDEAVEHGQAVFHHARQAAPGTPVYFLTGSSADEVVTDLLRHADRVDVWGTRQTIPTVQLLRKAKLTDLLGELRTVAVTIQATDDIEISTLGRDLSLNPQQRRVLRVFTRRRCGTLCEVAPISGGLSDSRVFRITVRDPAGVVQVVAVGKIADIDSVDDEVQRFDQHVNRLQAGSFPQKIEVVRAGARRSGGVFYRLLEGFEFSLSSLLALTEKRASEAVARVRNLTVPWTAGVPTSLVLVADIRRRLLADDIASSLIRSHSLVWAEKLEGKRIQTKLVDRI